jgi:hypothetical protein
MGRKLATGSDARKKTAAGLSCPTAVELQASVLEDGSSLR